MSGPMWSMARCRHTSPVLCLMPSTGWSAMTLHGELPKWEVGGGGVVTESLFPNKGRSGFLRIRMWCCDCPLAGSGVEGEGCGAAQFIRSGIGAGKLIRVRGFDQQRLAVLFNKARWFSRFC